MRTSDISEPFGGTTIGSNARVRGAAISRRSLLKVGAVAAGGIGALGVLPGVAGATVRTGSAQPNPAGLSNYKGLYAIVGIYTSASYWIGPKAALVKAESVYPGVKTLFTGIDGGEDSQLVAVIEEVLTKNPLGLMIEPTSPVDVQSVIQLAKRKGIPSVTVNSGTWRMGQRSATWVSADLTRAHSSPRHWCRTWRARRALSSARSSRSACRRWSTCSPVSRRR